MDALRSHADGEMVVAGHDRGTELAVLARSRGFVGSYGASAVAAALLGRQTIAVTAAEVSQDDLRLASSFLPSLRIVDAEAGMDGALAALAPLSDAVVVR